jgi:uncharacterized protein (TIGR02231 family)
VEDLNTTITAVTVYVDRARVTRRGVMELKPGVQQLEIQQLPISILPESVRIAARGSVQARLLDLQLGRAFHVESPDENVHQLEDRIEDLRMEKQDLKFQVERAKQTRDNLAAITAHSDTFALALASGEMSLESQLALFERLYERMAVVDSQIQSLTKDKHDLDLQMEKLENELEQWRGAGRRESYTARIGIDVVSAGELTLDLSYVISNANWEPLYDVRLLVGEEQGSVAIGYLAQVTQRSGEDWGGVDLALSTARPILSDTLPELDPWYIQPFRPPIPLPRRAPAPGVAMMSAPPADAAPTPLAQEPIPETIAKVESSGSIVTYKVPMEATIPTDGTPHKVTIARFSLEPKLDYVAAPKLTEAVYRRANLTNESTYTLLSGDVNLFAEDEFVGTSQLELTAQGGEFELYFGVDDRIQVSRELVHREVDKKFIGGKKRILFGYQVELKNLLTEETTITLHDQIPVSRHEEVKVILESVDPAIEEHTELNLLKWVLTLNPGEEQSVRFDFRVEFPRDMNLVGLP